MLTAGATNGILTNEVNVGFTPEGKYLTAGNDVVDLSKWNGSGSVNIGDAFSNDNDKVAVMADDLAAGANLKLTSIENLEIVNAGVAAPVILNGANFKGLESIKLIGDATTLNVSDFTYGIKVDATANADSIIGSDKADTINGGAGNDIIIGNGGVDILTGGNGADEFVVGNARNFGIDQILDFSSEDKITLKGFSAQDLKKFDASTFSTVTYKTLDSVLATFGQDGANETKAGDVVIFSYNGKTYALLANGAFNEGTDALVDITGANVASLTESNFGTSGAFENYADFKTAVDEGKVTATTTIKSITADNVAALLTTDKNYLNYIEDGGIGAVTETPVDVLTVIDARLDTTIFAKKLGAGVTISAINITGTNDGDTITSSFTGKINGGAGDDTITLSTAATIDGGSGNDTINASTAIGSVTIIDGSGKDTITGGAGNDDITLTVGNSSADSDTIIFGASKAANGQDTITNFTAGATTGSGDVLNFKAFLDGQAAGTIVKGSGLLGTSGLDLATSSNKVGVTAVDGGTIGSGNIATSGSNKVLINDNSKAVVLVVNTSNISSAGAVNIYYVQDTNAATDAQTWDVQLVGKITNSIAANTFVDGNFA